MSTFRKTVLTTAIIGAGLASTAGSAFATECHDDGGHHHKSSHSHSTTVNDSSCTSVSSTGDKSAEGLVAIANVADIAPAGNICHVLENNLNGNLSNNNVALLGDNLLP